MSPRRVRLLALLFFLASAALSVYLLRRPSIVFLVGSASVGSAVYLFVSRDSRPQTVEEAPFEFSPVLKNRIKRAAVAAFFLLTAISLVDVARHPQGKTDEYYGLVAAAAACIAVRAVLVDGRREVRMNLALILLFALNLFGTDQIAFPIGLGGGDSGTHLFFLVEPIMQTGHIPPISACGLFYVTFPAHHVLVASAAFLDGWPAPAAYYMMGALVMCLPVLVAFLVVRRLVGERAGLLAGLLLAGSSYYIYWAAHAATLTFAMPLIAVLIFLMMKAMDHPKVALFGLIALFLFGLILTHPYSSVVFGFVIVSILLGQAIVRRDRPAVIWSPLILGSLFLYILLIYWSNYTCVMTKSFQLASGYYSAILNENLGTAPAIYDALPLATIFVNTIGDSLLLVLVVIGFFILLSQGLDGRRMLIVAPTAALLALAATGLFTRLEYLLPNRVYVFLEVLGLAPLAAVALRDMRSWRFRRRGRWRPYVVLLVTASLVFAFTLASASSTIAGFETSPYVGTQPYTKLYDTRYENASASWLCENLPRGTLLKASRSLFTLDRYELQGCLNTAIPVVGSINYRDATPSGQRSVLDLSGLVPGTYVLFSAYDSNPGYQKGITAVGQTGKGVLSRLDPASIVAFSPFDKVYVAGPEQVYWVEG